MNESKNCCTGCSCISLIISTVLAAVIGIMLFFQMLPNIVTAIWIAFGLGILSLFFLLVGIYRAAAEPCGIFSKCLCAYGRCLLIGSMGTIVCALAALAIVLRCYWIFSVILVAVGAFFTVLMLLSLFAILMCFVCAVCRAQK